MGNCLISSDESSCGTAFGTCTNEHCVSSCVKEAKAAEERAEDALKRYIAEHVQTVFEAQIRSLIATHIAASVVQPTEIEVHVPNALTHDGLKDSGSATV